jgi:cytochrome bd-type quinol oxidase subunit 2
MRQRLSWVRGGGSGLAALAALVTTLCCLGFPALVGVLAALGAGFLINDRYLEPLLIVLLLLTLVIVGLHLRRHRQPWPFILSVVSAGSVFFALYGIRWFPQVVIPPLPAWSPYLAYGAILVLLGVQVWDLWLYRQCLCARRTR